MILRAMKALRLAGETIAADTLFGVEDAALAAQLVQAGLAAPARGDAAVTILSAVAFWRPADPELRRGPSWVRDGALKL